MPGGYFPTNIKDFLALTDNEVLSALYAACVNETKPGHDAARRIINRSHYKRIYEFNPDDLKINPDAAGTIYKKLKDEFDENQLRFDQQKPKSSANNFPVLRSDNGKIVSALSLSETLNHIPTARAEFIFVDPKISKTVTKWLEKNKKRTLELKGDE
ncbi:MAG: hypothetical protein STSR0009_26790 [Methanoregula sp.]